jgi:hypothetical protein
MADGDVDIPKVGRLPKKVWIPLGVGIAGFVAWRFYQARQTADASPITDGEFGAVDTSIPDTLNPYPGSFTGGGGGGGGNNNSGDTNNDGVIGPGEFTTNAQWTAWAVDALQGDRWSTSDIQLALGLLLAGKPTTSAQQDIGRAAQAAAGPPPAGQLQYVSGGNTTLTSAPTGVSVSTTEESATVSFTGVNGAARYLVYRSGTGAGGPVAASGSPTTVGGLAPNTTYTFQVAGVTTAGVTGPKSSPVSATTKAYNLGKAATPTITGVNRGGATAKTSTVAHAAEYLWYLNGMMVTATKVPQYTFTGLKPGTKYTVAVVGRISGQNAGGRSGNATFTTKK